MNPRVAVLTRVSLARSTGEAAQEPDSTLLPQGVTALAILDHLDFFFPSRARILNL